MRSFARQLTCFAALYFLVLSNPAFADGQKGNIPSADLVLVNGTVFTSNPSTPMAKAVVVNGNIIEAVYQSNQKARKHVGPKTRLIDLQGKFVTPGIIDGHVHFNRADALINDANLMTVSDRSGLRKEKLITGRPRDLIALSSFHRKLTEKMPAANFRNYPI